MMDSRTCSLLAETRVGLHLGSLAPRVQALGSVAHWPPGALLCRKGEGDRRLFVLLEGEVAHPHGWLGAGAHLGELGFLLGVPRTADLLTRTPTRAWVVASEAMARDPEAATMLIAGLVRELPRRLRTFAPPTPDVADYCDCDHPAVRSLAAALRQPSPAGTAEAIWSFVRDLPYRFGPWWQKASETLRAGWGMCTTKSNLEVALLRAAGLEAGFVEFRIDADLMAPLLPTRWRSHVKPRTRHYMGAVKLDGRWHAAECSYSDAVLAELARHVPCLSQCVGRRLEPGRPFHPLACALGQDPFPVEVVPSIDQAMKRRSSFDLEQLDLLNLVNDALQPTILDEPAWLLRARALLEVDPVRAMHMALAAAAVLAAELHDRITESA